MNKGNTMKVDETKTRAYTIAILEMMDEGLLDPKQLVQDLLGELSERDVKRFAQEVLTELFNEEEEEDEL
jgi:hypothetical protein